ncbi:MAG: formyltransferase family protein [Planctomycetota bacterium]
MTTQPVQTVVLLTRDGLEHRYVAAKLREVCPELVIILESGGPSRRWHRFAKLPLRVQVSRLCRKCLLKLLRDAPRREAVLRSRLGSDCSDSLADVAASSVQSWRGQPATTAVQRLGPDLLLVYGTSIVPDVVLGHARVIALNMHTGVSPRYRGADCAFWPLANREPQWLGASVHQCTSRLDGGRLFETSRANLERVSCVHSAFAECVIAGSQIYAQVVGQLVAGEQVSSIEQDLATGREYRSFMRGLSAEVRARIFVRSLRTGRRAAR